MSRFLSAALFLSLAGIAAHAQSAVPAGQGDPLKDTSMLKPPAGAKVAIIEWEDMECPACSHAFPVVHAAIDHYKIPLVRHDFLIPGHIWSRDAAITARYLQDKVSPAVATDYRRQVFATQYKIASKDDLRNFTTSFFKAHNLQMPFVMDPTGQFIKEIQADHDLGLKMGLVHTPTLIVATNRDWVQVVDTSQLYSVIDKALAESPAPAKSAAAGHKTTTTHKKK